jgi:predicted phage terminase large subunit-like protein
VRDIHDAGMRAVFFRRETPQITAPGGLWEDARELYQRVGAEFVASPQHKVTFPSGATVTFSHMQHEDDRYNWDGAQIPLIYFDQLEQFTERQFWHLALGRNRSGSGVESRVRATCNPLPKMWLSELLKWWWNDNTGYAIPERSGVIRYFIRSDNTLFWGNSPEELRKEFPDIPDDEFLPISLTFIPSTLDDNPIGVKRNPRYAAALQALPLVERERGRKGNWKIEDITGDGLIHLEWWKDKIISLKVWNEMDKKEMSFKRGWDPAGGETKGADYSAGVLTARHKDGRKFVVHVARGKWSPNNRELMMNSVYESDQAQYGAVPHYAWKSRTPDMNRSILKGMDYRITLIPEKGSKLDRAKASFAPAVEAGNYYLVEGDWNAEFILEGAMFTGEDSDQIRKDDQIDGVVLSDKMQGQSNV